MDKPSLNRIRDNQRRSRARRKAYVQDLEKRLRSLERQGVEASSVIQQAARKVAEENRLLRDLLFQQGFENGKINQFLQTNNVTASSPAIQDSPQAIGFTPQTLGLLLEHQPVQLFNPTAHSANFVPEFANLEEDDSFTHTILPNQRKVSASSAPACAKAYYLGSESPASHSPFDFGPSRYSTSFSSESSDTCTIDSTEHLDQLYASTANNHPISGEAHQFLETTRTNHGPLPLGPIDLDMELVCIDSTVYDHLAALQLQQGEGMPLDDLESVQSAVTMGFVADHNVPSDFDLGQKRVDYTTNPEYYCRDVVSPLHSLFKFESQRDIIAGDGLVRTKSG